MSGSNFWKQFLGIRGFSRKRSQEEMYFPVFLSNYNGRTPFIWSTQPLEFKNLVHGLANLGLDFDSVTLKVGPGSTFSIARATSTQ